MRVGHVRLRTFLLPDSYRALNPKPVLVAAHVSSGEDLTLTYGSGELMGSEQKAVKGLCWQKNLVPNPATRTSKPYRSRFRA